LDTLLKKTHILHIWKEAQKGEKPFGDACTHLIDHTDIVKWANECNQRDYDGRSHHKAAYVFNDFEPSRKIAYTNKAPQVTIITRKDQVCDMRMIFGTLLVLKMNFDHCKSDPMDYNQDLTMVGARGALR
jgi:hypothetical protein